MRSTQLSGAILNSLVALALLSRGRAILDELTPFGVSRVSRILKQKGDDFL
jgi:hypothetical protein